MLNYIYLYIYYILLLAPHLRLPVLLRQDARPQGQHGRLPHVQVALDKYYIIIYK